MTLFKLIVARTFCYLLIPLIVGVGSIAFAAVAFGIVAALMQIQLIGVWLSLILVQLFKVPVTIFFEKMGCGDGDVKYDGFERKSTKWLLWASEGPVFKYYFTSSLQVASVVIQFFVLTKGFAAFEFDAGTERYERFLAPYGGLYGRLYSDFFTLSTYQMAVSLGSLDFAFNWRLPPIGMPDLSIDVVLSQLSQLTYMVGLLLLVIEKAIGVTISIFERVGQAAQVVPVV
jgi:hypothetical protein